MDTIVPAPRVPFEQPGKRAVINAWLRNIYFIHEFRAGTLSITVEDFLQILATGESDSEKSWLTDDQVAIPLVLLAETREERSDTLVVTTSPASALANVGLGISTRENFIDAYPDAFAVMERENTRWIVVPCNDGMTLQGDVLAAAEAKKKKDALAKKDGSGAPTSSNKPTERPVEASSNDKEPTQVGRRDEGVGQHWGFMIIDKTIEAAWWLDGDLTVRRGRKGLHIYHMYRAGWAAGKILCGYDKVMRREPGRFTASTLKHVPHDHQDNGYKRDGGSSCGPWLFAMFRYILEHHDFLTVEQGLKATFARKNLPRHRAAMRFNSSKTRYAMQEIIRTEAEKFLPVEGLPYGLTAQVLDILGIYDARSLLNSLNVFLGRRNAPRRRNKARSPDRRSRGDGRSSSDNDDDDDYWVSANVEDLQRISKEHFLKGSYRDRMAQAYELYKAFQLSLHSGLDEKRKRSKAQPFNIAKAVEDHDAVFVSMSPAIVTDFVNKKPIGETLTTNLDKWEQRLILQHIFGDLDQLTPEETSLWRTKDPRFKILQNAPKKPWTHEQTIERLKKDVAHIVDPSVRGKLNYYPDSYIEELEAQHASSVATTDTREGWPEEAEHPKKLPNFARISEEEKDFWVGANAALFTKKEAGHNGVTDRAILHIRFKNTFRNETQEDLDEVWAHDGAVFGEVGLGTVKGDEVVHMLREYYEALQLTLAAVAARREKETVELRKLLIQSPKAVKRKPTGKHETEVLNSKKRRKTQDDQ